MYSLKVIRLASDAISVPVPPIFTPISKSCQLFVKLESRIELGTLLIIWHSAVLVISGFFIMASVKKLLKISILAIFPEKMKKAIKVPRIPQSIAAIAFLSKNRSETVIINSPAIYGIVLKTIEIERINKMI